MLSAGGKTHEDIDIRSDQANSEAGVVAFTYRRVLSHKNETIDAYSEVDIEAEPLRKVLKEQIGSDYPGQNFSGETVNLAAPFGPLVSEGIECSGFQSALGPIYNLPLPNI